MKRSSYVSLFMIATIVSARCQNASVPWSAFSGASGLSAFTNNAVWSSPGYFSGRPVQGGNIRVGSGFLAGLSGQPVLTSVEEPAAVPAVFQLHQNFPNPFNPSTTISFALPGRSVVTVQIFNILGQLVATLAHGEQPAGNHSVTWRGRSDSGAPVSSGIYFYRIHAKSQSGDGAEFAQTRRLILLK